jgi:LuxR family maltose regulon positive regulatory protein
MQNSPIHFVPRTKLRPPRVPGDVILRTRLLERLDRSQTLTLIIAPAGHGKTTLAATWVAHCSRPSAWVSLDREDSSLVVFLMALVNAVRTVFPAFGTDLLNLLEEQTCELAPALVLPLLLNGLDLLHSDFVLVLDDYHHISDTAIHELLWGLLAHPPRPLQLVLTSRYDPPIPPRIRVQGLITEIRARELCFTATETHEFLAQYAAHPFDAQSISALAEHSGGWVVPLRLMAMLISQRQDMTSLDEALHKCGRYVLDYLDAEVTGQLPVDVQAFLVHTSILSRLNGSLCDAVVGQTLAGIDSAATLRMLADAGIFVERLDEDGYWFCYQELFRTLLQRRLRSTTSTANVGALFQRARCWYEQHGLSEGTHLPTLGLNDWPAVTHRCGQSSSISTAPTLLPLAPKVRAPVHPERNLRDLLTFREMDVMLLLRQRLTNKEIACTLGVSPETIRQHTVNIYRKLGVENRRQAVVQADTMGLTSGEST